MALDAGVHPATPLLPRLVQNWRARRAVRILERLDDYMLRDMGLTRDDLAWARGLPLSINVSAALESRRLHMLRQR